MNKIMSFALLVTVSLLFTPQSFGQTAQKQKVKPGREQTQKNTESAAIDKTQWPHCCWVDITSEVTAKPAQENIPADSTAATSAPAAASGLSAGGGEAPSEEAVTEETTKTFSSKMSINIIACKERRAFATPNQFQAAGIRNMI